MTKDEMKNRISMALKDSVLQQGFEIICKENAELKEQIEKMKCCENCKHYKPCLTVNDEIGNMCDVYYNGCNNSKYAPFNRWEIKEK